MNDPFDSPFGPDTLTIDAVIVREGQDNPPSHQDLAMSLGGDTLTLPAVLVPLGGARPTGDWVKLGVAQLPKQGVKAASGGNPPAGPVSPDWQAPEGQRPETRFYHPRGVAPAPNAGLGPIVTGAAQWQRMKVMDVVAERTRNIIPKIAAASNLPPTPSIMTTALSDQATDGTQPGRHQFSANPRNGPSIAFRQQAVAFDTGIRNGLAPIDAGSSNNVQLAASADDSQGLKMAAAAAREGGLRTSEELEIFHDAITGRNITKFSELVDIARQIAITGGY